MRTIPTLAVIIALGASVFAADSAPLSLDIGELGAHAGDYSDTTPTLRAALVKCQKDHVRKLVFPPGRYDFWPDVAAEKYLFISNNDEGLKRIAFPLLGFQNLEIDGQGSQFVFHGYLNPFVLEKARDITLKNFSIDFARTFHSEAKVLEVRADSVDLEIPEQFPYRIEKGILFFVGEGKGSKEIYPVTSLLEFDAEKHETAFKAGDQGLGKAMRATEIGPRRVRLELPKLKATPGNIFVFQSEHRLIPAFTISDSIGTKLVGVTIYHAGGMGVVAQRSRDIELDHVQVTRPPGSGRYCSLTADATHFSNCAGKIVMSHCLFENQMDDATNIHGIYAQVARQIAPDEILVRLKHPQQFGFDFISAGTRLELVHGPSMATYGEGTVKSTERLNKEFTRVVFKSPLPKDLVAGDAVASVNEYPEVNINHCTIRDNRARGLLIASRGKVVIEDNVFHTPGSAILFEGDASYWFEQSGVRDVLIRRNHFENCNFGPWGAACIQVRPGIKEEDRAAVRYNRNITIEENTFRVFDPRLICAYCVDGLTFRKNHIEPTTEYPPQNQTAKPFEISDSDHVVIEAE